MKDLRIILRLIIIAILMTLGLLTFALANRDRFVYPELLPGCGTVGMENDHNRKPLDHKGRKVFEDNCKACHSLDKKLVGPALRYTFQMRDSIWYRKMIRNADQLIQSGDTLAVRLFNEYNETRQPSFEGMSDEMLTDLIAYLKLEGLRE